MTGLLCKHIPDRYEHLVRYCAIEIVLRRALDARAHFDGFALTELAQGDWLLLKRSADAVRFVHPPGYSYFAKTDRPILSALSAR